MNEVFEALKFIFNEALFSEYRNETHTKVRECNDIVLKALTELQQIKSAELTYKKAFELINEKRVDIKLLHWAYPSVEAYNVDVREQKDTWKREELTKEEFEFLGRLAGAK